jgi:hypothetical protein
MYVKGGRCDGAGRRILTQLRPDAVLCGKTQPPALLDPAGCSVVREDAATRPVHPASLQWSENPAWTGPDDHRTPHPSETCARTESGAAPQDSRRQDS